MNNARGKRHGFEYRQQAGTRVSDGKGFGYGRKARGTEKRSVKVEGLLWRTGRKMYLNQATVCETILRVDRPCPLIGLLSVYKSAIG